MAPIPSTPKHQSRSLGRPRGVATELPKRLKYVPGGPGGGGRYVDPDSLRDTANGSAGPGGSVSVGPRTRVPRPGTERRYGPPSPLSLPTIFSRPRRERTSRPSRPSRPTPGPRSSSAQAAAVAQSDGYKPREERSWEEFHQHLDIEAPFVVFSAHLVDGRSPPDTPPKTPQVQLNASATTSGGAVNGISGDGSGAPSETQGKDQEKALGQSSNDTSDNAPKIQVPVKRRPGRPPRKLDSMLTGLGSPPAPKITPLPTHNPKEKLNLSKPVYKEVDTFTAYEQDQRTKKENYVDKSLANVGYQESDIFDRREKTLHRYKEGPIEDEVDQSLDTRSENGVATGAAVIGQVEYDMDEQDARWLDAYNIQRKADDVEGIRPAIFEITMTQIEKEWHFLEKRIPKPNPKPPQTHRPRSSSAAAVNGEPAGPGEEQDTKCAVCDDGDCENTNAIVFCDGCDLAVHQECYGVPFIPEGQWLCRKCQLMGRGSPTCIFCPNLDGAFKQTNTMRWSHLLCAIWIPEVSLGNTTFMEPVMDVEKVQKQRWKLSCYICRQKMGACIQCGNKNCYEAFHVTCARKARLFLKMKSTHGSGILDASILKAFCHRHSPPEWKREHDVESATEDAKAFYRQTMRGRRWGDSQQVALGSGVAALSLAEGAEGQGADEPTAAMGSNKRKRGQSQTNIWRLPSGAPIVPFIVFHNVENAMAKFSIRKRKEYVAEACKYWTLKREARRGAALLKRLQLQMETFTSMEITRRNFAGMGAVGGPKLERRIAFVDRLEEDMGHIRELCLKIMEREAKKLEDVQILRTIVDSIYSPLTPLLWEVFEKAVNLDTKYVFADGFRDIQVKLEERHYSSVVAFAEDLATVLSRASIPINDESKVATEVANAEVSSTQATLGLDPKEIKKLSKRIMRAVQPPLNEVANSEALLARKLPEETEVQELEVMVDRIVASQRASVVAREEMAVNGARHDVGGGEYNVNGLDEDSAEHAPSMQLVKEMSESEIARRGLPGSETSDNAILGISRSEKTEEAVIRLKVGSDSTVPIGSADPTVNGNDKDDVGGESAPALSYSGSTLPSTSNPEPSTPQQQEKDLLRPLRDGGIPWYAEQFDPVGTTVWEERWTGPDVLRGLSEELSEMDEEEMNELMDQDMAEAPTKAAPVVVAAPSSKNKKRRKARGYY